MASSENGEAEDTTQLTAELGKTLKEGERLLASTRRPDGSLRKPIRIRAGYVPQDEVPIYLSKGALVSSYNFSCLKFWLYCCIVFSLWSILWLQWKKEMAATQEVPPGYDPAAETKPKSKSAKRNERKKEKRQQVNFKKKKKKS